MVGLCCEWVDGRCARLAFGFTKRVVARGVLVRWLGGRLLVCKCMLTRILREVFLSGWVVGLYGEFVNGVVI